MFLKTGFSGFVFPNGECYIIRLTIRITASEVSVKCAVNEYVWPIPIIRSLVNI